MARRWKTQARLRRKEEARSGRLHGGLEGYEGGRRAAMRPGDQPEPERKRTCVQPDAERDSKEARSGRLHGSPEGREDAAREELAEQLRRLAQWKNNDVVKLAFLESGDAGEVERLDLTGVVELKRNPNGTFEAKFVDKVRVLAMLRELLEQKEDGRLEDFMDALRPEDGDEA